MENNTTAKEPIPLGMRLELMRATHNDVTATYADEVKLRRKREFVLIVICLLAVIYTYPVTDFSQNPNIEIPAISLKIPLKDAVAVFPTIVSAIYLVFLSSALKQSQLLMRLRYFDEAFKKIKEEGEVINESAFYSGISFSINLLRYIFLPSPLHARGFVITSGFHTFVRTTVEIFVGIVFTGLPFLVTIFLLVKSYTLLGNIWINIWNTFCLSVMLLALISASLSSRISASLSSRW